MHEASVVELLEVAMSFDTEAGKNILQAEERHNLLSFGLKYGNFIPTWDAPGSNKILNSLPTWEALYLPQLMLSA